ncbi:uncharacterized protein [Rhodnius prolixus]|uniref:uncharacterized protein n=1 Tax=Rhodnius prolixus TaxID=13249 RepID=UPI003D18E5B5
MPPKKSNLNNASSKGSRRKRVERAQQLPEQIETRNAAQRIRTAESRAQESQEQHSTIPFKRLQFPIRLAFAMSINKSQGQTMSICGLDLENPCFSHGQLYVACSRVGKPSNLFVLAKDRLTKNIVHRLVLN